MYLTDHGKFHNYCSYLNLKIDEIKDDAIFVVKIKENLLAILHNKGKDDSFLLVTEHQEKLISYKQIENLDCEIVEVTHNSNTHILEEYSNEI